MVMFSKEFENNYHYGIIKDTNVSKEGLIRNVDVEYQNPNENNKCVTKRGARELVVIHPYDELGISRELYDLAAEAQYEANACSC